MTSIQSQPAYRASTFKLETSPTTWEQALAHMPNGHALQSWTWADFKSAWGWQKRPLSLTIAGGSWEPLATAMVLKRKVPRLPFSILYVPKGPALNYRDGPLRRTVFAELEEIARQEKAIFIKIDPEVVRSWGLAAERISPTSTLVMEDLSDRGWRFSEDQIQFRNTVEIDLSRNEDDILAGMKSKTRYNIRLAGRKGVIVRAGTQADFPAFAQMYQETAARDGFGIRPAAYYEDIWDRFIQADMGHLLLAEYNDEPIAGVYLVKYGAKAIYMYGASTQNERNRMPNYLLQWEAIKWAKAAGCQVYDFWGAPDDFVETDRLWGVWRFKAGFNGEVVRTIGAWDYPARPFWYWFYTGVMPKYLNFRRSRAAQTVNSPS